MNIIVLAGGISTEREVSINTGYMVCNALREKGHSAILLDVYFGTKVNDIHRFFEQEYNLDQATNEMKLLSGKIAQTKSSGKTFFGENVLDLCAYADVVFMALHGEDGENGKLQGSFDLLNIKYTGTGYLGSALAMDKDLAKQLFLTNNIPTPNGIVLKSPDITFNEAIGFPCVVKPCCGGSSVGVSIVENIDEYEKALQQAFNYETEIIVEKYIKGREFSVGVIDNQALPIIEIAPKDGFYDYEHKYIAGMTEEICPAKIDSDTSSKMQEIALKVGKVLKLGTYYRVDFLMDINENLFCLEANTLPGMTATSLLPQEALAIGLTFGDLCEKIIQLSINKF